MKSDAEPNSVEEALEVYWLDKSVGHHVPNYGGFEIWIGKRRDLKRSEVPLPLHAGGQERDRLPKELLAAARAGGVQITPDGATPHPTEFARWDGKQSRLKRMNKSKLLLMHFKQSEPRWREFLLAMSKPDLSSNSVLRTSPQSEHRVAFFVAVDNGDEHTASKMVGRLREEAHDPGEVSFLEATASFHANRFKEAIKLAREVPNHAVDWPRAFMLVLESYAYLGELGSIEAELNSHPEFIFPAYFVLYVCQVAVKNSSSPEDEIEQALHIIEKAFAKTHPGPGAFQMWNRHSCQLAVQFIEQSRDAKLTNAALFQSGNVDALQESTAAPLSKLEQALLLDGHLVDKICQGSTSADNASVEIVKRLMNCGHSGKIEFIQALTAQWRIGGRVNFLENVLASIDALMTNPKPETLEVIIWAYSEAKQSNRQSDAELLRLKLLDVPEAAEKLHRIEDANANSRLEEHLSPMGLVSLRSANWDLDRALKEKLMFKDAGMISLGFFRIIELEFNWRIILPSVRSFDFESLDASLTELKALGAGRAAKDAVSFWEQMLPLLRRAKLKQIGLELGSLERLLGKISKLGGPDIKLKSSIHAEIVRRLTPIGLDALRSGVLAQLLDAASREKFRNPPAHTRYVSLAVASECKEHVETVLRQLIKFTVEPVHALLRATSPEGRGE